MRTLVITFLFLGFNNCSICSSVEDNRTLTEMLFKGNSGTIFTCKILTFSTPQYPNNMTVSNTDGGIDGTATAEVINIYFGKIDTNIVTLRAGSYLSVGKIYLIYSSSKGRIFSLARGTKPVTESLEIKNELSILSKFSDIFKNKLSGKFTFVDSYNMVLAIGQFKKGIATHTWKHFYNNGIIKAEYDLKNNITSQFFTNGFLKLRITIKGNTENYEHYSGKVKGQLSYSESQVKNDTGFVMTVYVYYENGRMKNISSQIIINDQGGGCFSGGRTGDYKEYYENGNLKLSGQYQRDKRVGIWKWYYLEGKFNTEFDYKDGTRGQ